MVRELAELSKSLMKDDFGIGKTGDYVEKRQAYDKQFAETIKKVQEYNKGVTQVYELAKQKGKVYSVEGAASLYAGLEVLAPQLNGYKAVLKEMRRNGYKIANKRMVKKWKKMISYIDKRLRDVVKYRKHDIKDADSELRKQNIDAHHIVGKYKPKLFS